jgi:hypothetical protein
MGMRSVLTPEQLEKWQQGFGPRGQGHGRHGMDRQREPRAPRIGQAPGCRRF